MSCKCAKEWHEGGAYPKWIEICNITNSGLTTLCRVCDTVTSWRR